MILIAAHYRSHLIVLGILRRVQWSSVCSTVALPPFAESQSRNCFLITQCKIFRASSDRSNLEYRVLIAFKETFQNDSAVISDQELIEAAVIICSADGHRWTRKNDCMQRGICCVQRKSIGETLAKNLQCSFYQGPRLQGQVVSFRWTTDIFSASSEPPTCALFQSSFELKISNEYLPSDVVPIFPFKKFLFRTKTSILQTWSRKMTLQIYVKSWDESVKRLNPEIWPLWDVLFGLFRFRTVSTLRSHTDEAEDIEELGNEYAYLDEDKFSVTSLHAFYLTLKEAWERFGSLKIFQKNSKHGKTGRQI